MKISLLSALYPYRGGIAQSSANLLDALKETHEIQPVTFTRQYPDFLFPGETQYVTQNDAVTPIDTIRSLDSINPLSWYKTARIINQFEPDVLITRYWMTFFGPSLGTVSKKMNLKTKRISILDNVIPHEKRFFDAPSNKYFLNNNDGFIVMSDSVLNDLLKIKPNAHYLRIDHPISEHFGQKMERVDACAQLGLDPSKKTVLFFGIIRDYKGLDLLLEATSLLSDEYCVVIAGEVYGSFDKYQVQIDQLNLSNRIRLFNQYIEDQKVAQFFSAADVCVLPYKSATQSGITAIAMYFELPIIATNVGGLKELVHHEKTGMIIDELKPEHLASAIKKYFEEHKKETFSRAIAVQKEQHTWKHFADKLCAFSEQIHRQK